MSHARVMEEGGGGRRRGGAGEGRWGGEGVGIRMNHGAFA